jgi:hypothetical protein
MPLMHHVHHTPGYSGAGGASGLLMFFDLRMRNWVLHEGTELSGQTHVKAEHVVRHPVSRGINSRANAHAEG